MQRNKIKSIKYGNYYKNKTLKAKLNITTKILGLEKPMFLERSFF